MLASAPMAMERICWLCWEQTGPFLRGLCSQLVAKNPVSAACLHRFRGKGVFQHGYHGPESLSSWEERFLTTSHPSCRQGGSCRVPAFVSLSGFAFLSCDGGYEQVIGEGLLYHTSQRESSNICPESGHFSSSQPNSCWKPPGRSPPPPMVGPGKMQ